MCTARRNAPVYESFTVFGEAVRASARNRAAASIAHPKHLVIFSHVAMLYTACRMPHAHGMDGHDMADGHVSQKPTKSAVMTAKSAAVASRFTTQFADAMEKQTWGRSIGGEFSAFAARKLAEFGGLGMGV